MLEILYNLAGITATMALALLIIGIFTPVFFERHFQRNRGRKFVGLLFACVFIVSGLVLAATGPPKQYPGGAAQQKPASGQPAVLPTVTVPTGETYEVVRVIDGDTVDVKRGGKNFRVRLIGIDTPEKNDPRTTVECFSSEASNSLTHLVLGKTVVLEADDSQDNKDRYGRLLRFVWLGQENINKTMLAGGFAYEYTYDKPYKYQQEFKQAQEDAKNNAAGLWSPSTCSGQRVKVTEPVPVPAATPPAVPGQAGECDPNYTPCVPAVDWDMDCSDIGFPVRVVGTDKHRFDINGDGYGCEGYRPAS